ncbi:hypothetical protein CYMTET_6566, partial [Cymbomonas tetramitiformis]
FTVLKPSADTPTISEADSKKSIENLHQFLLHVHKPASHLEWLKWRKQRKADAAVEGKVNRAQREAAASLSRPSAALGPAGVPRISEDGDSLRPLHDMLGAEMLGDKPPELVGEGGGMGPESWDASMPLESMLRSSRLQCALRMMQLLVEGHYHAMQNLFQSQADFSAESIDMLSELVRFLEALQPGVADTFLTTHSNVITDPTIVNITIQVLATILELIQGPCHTTLEATVRSPFLQVAERLIVSCKYNPQDDLLDLEDEDSNTISLKNQMKTMILDIYLALMSIHSLSPVKQAFVNRRMTGIINYHLLMEEAEHIRSFCAAAWAEDAAPAGTLRIAFASRAIRQASMSSQDQEAWQKRLLSLRSEALKRVFLTMEMDEFNMQHAQLDEPTCSASLCAKRQRVGGFCFGHARMITKELNDFFLANTCSVEVHHNNRIQKIHFEVTRECRAKLTDRQWQQRAKETMYDVPRGNPKEKMEGMIDRMALVLFSLKHHKEMGAGRNRYLSYLMQDYIYLMLLQLPFYISLVILTVATFTYGKSISDWEANAIPNTIAAVLGYSQVAVCTLVFVLFIVKEARVISFKERQRENKEDLEHLLKVSTSINWNWQTASAVLQNYRFWFLVVFVVGASLGVILSPFFFSIHLTDFLVHSPAGQEVMHTVLVGGPMLMRTGCVGLLVIFLYSICGWVFFSEYLDRDIATFEESHDRPYSSDDNKFCHTLFECVGMHLITGFSNLGSFEGVYGDAVNEWYPARVVPSYYYNDPIFQVRTLFILSFTIIWGFLVSNIMTGQIVEAFTQIRQNRLENSRDLEEKCFICSRDRYAFEQRKGTGEFGFQHHIEHEHNPLHYLFYLDYLMQIDVQEFTGVESFVAKALRDMMGKRTEWLPINRALQLERIEQQQLMSRDDDASTEQQRHTLSTIQLMESHMKHVDSKLRHLEEAHKESCAHSDERLRSLEDMCSQMLLLLVKREKDQHNGMEDQSQCRDNI